MTVRGTNKTGMIGAAMAAVLLLVASPVFSATKLPDSKARVVAAKKKARSIGYFTPAAADPRRGAMLGTSFGDSSFRFTPSGGGARRAVTVAIRARATTKAVAARSAVAMASGSTTSGLEPSAYSLGASLGWKRFALAGDIARVDGGLLPESREIADLGLSYNAPKWSTRLMFGAERAADVRSHIAGIDESMSVDLGGSYAITNNIEVGGGVRYKSQRERVDLASDQRRDSQAVYVGTAFRF